METIHKHFKKSIIDIAKLIEESKETKTYLIIQLDKPNFVYIGLGFFVADTKEFLRMDLETAQKTSAEINKKDYYKPLGLFCCVIPIDEYLNNYYEKYI